MVRVVVVVIVVGIVVVVIEVGLWWSLGCSIPNTWMEFGQGRPNAGCLMPPLVNIQSPGPQKFHVVRNREVRGLASFGTLNKLECNTWGKKV